MDYKNVVTRFAPSPTGSIHVGNTRSVIWNYLFAKHYKGKLILRIEDTDLVRSKREDELELRKNLEWLGITFDEGNLDHPYRQSERLDIYKEYAYKLLEEGKAYRCFCTDAELDVKREKAKAAKLPHNYDRTCRKLSEEEIQKKLDQKIPFAIRMKVPDEDIAFDDMIKEHVVMKEGMFGDFVILRSQGVAVYNFCVVIDDMLMGVTHIMRAQEHLTNAAKQIIVYRALNANIPIVGHTPLLLAPDGSKLSKRYGATSLQEYRELGYLKDAIINYLATLGWTPPDGKEKMSMDELIERFTPDRITKSSSKFDIQKFRWINHLYIKEMDSKERRQEMLSYLKKYYDTSVYSDAQIEEILTHFEDGVEFFGQMKELAQLFFEYNTENLKELKNETTDKVAKLLLSKIEAMDTYSIASLESAVKEVGNELSLKGKNLFMPVRIVTTAQDHGPALFETLEILGKDRLVNRLKECLTL